jgi:hypothetical protein
MAIQPKNEYGAQTTTPGATYPYGRARNDTDVSAHDGTPLEEKWVNDLWGFLQGLLVEGEITPSGNPDTATDSQYLDALVAIAGGVAHTEFDSTVEDIQDDVTVLQAVESERIPAVYSVPLMMQVNSGSRFEYARLEDGGAPLGASTVIEQTDITNQGIITIPIKLPYSGARIKENGVTLWCKGATGHAALPAEMPAAEIAIRSSWGSESTLGVATDLSASVEAYEVEHSISIAMATRAIVQSDQLHVLFRGEASTNALVGLQLTVITVELEAVP